MRVSRRGGERGVEGRLLSIGFAILVAVAGASWAGVGHAQPLCENPAKVCSEEIAPACLRSQQVGAGSLPVADASLDCGGQLERYRSCLIDVATQCADANSAYSDRRASADRGVSRGMPTCAIGSWTGPVRQVGSRYSMRMTIAPSGTGPLTASTFYPELTCGGDSFEIPASDPEARRFAEEIQEPRNTCIDGEFVVRCRPDGGLDWLWYQQRGQEPYASAVLSRR